MTVATKFPNLATALIAFQKDIPSVSKAETADVPTKTGGKYSYSYASLEDVAAAVYPALAKVGLAYSAIADLDEAGNFGLRAELVHESGETRGGFYPLGNPNAPAQAIGSAITYARRYALLALTGVTPVGEDDDGAKADNAERQAPAKPAAAAKDTVETLRKRISELISGGKVTGDDANDVMKVVTSTAAKPDGKAPGQWTATDLKKGLALLEAKAAE